jgi:hypothetical protein
MSLTEIPLKIYPFVALSLSFKLNAADKVFYNLKSISDEMIEILKLNSFVALTFLLNN